MDATHVPFFTISYVFCVHKIWANSVSVNFASIFVYQHSRILPEKVNYLYETVLQVS